MAWGCKSLGNTSELHFIDRIMNAEDYVKNIERKHCFHSKAWE